jgi:hypothetical protein
MQQSQSLDSSSTPYDSRKIVQLGMNNQSFAGTQFTSRQVAAEQELVQVYNLMNNSIITHGP